MIKRCQNCDCLLAENDLVCPKCGQVFQTDDDFYLEEEVKPDQAEAEKKTKLLSRKKKADQEKWSAYAKDFFRCFLAFLRNPIKNIQNASYINSYYGVAMLIILTLTNTVTLTAMANFAFSNYGWLSSISILPNIDYSFNPWLFFVQALVYFFVMFWLIAAVSQATMRLIFKLDQSNLEWLTRFMGMNSLTVVLSILAMLCSLIAPLLFSILVLFLMLLEYIVFLISIPLLYYLYESRVAWINRYYASLLAIACFVLLNIFLINIIF
ncbi:hypothetical protein QP248_06895 [Aerococcus sp. UMB8608]|uniref:hypothetical protein n=1 Tax=Aerococcus sp. UMB8608 TaxID=3046347 RepID=UPI00254D6606|nr:hypothetical protein [Aerococcus sp. UMB8608]MDK6680177.1 hypothetical protein [Aerococcus sp. UMB8608]